MSAVARALAAAVAALALAGCAQDTLSAEAQAWRDYASAVSRVLEPT